MHLTKRSIEIILQNQAPSGAYVASPNFSQYGYCWFRDGAFTAYAMDLCGQFESARRFHQWATQVLLAREELIHRAVAKAGRGEALSAGETLHTRYTLDGGDVQEDEPWPNHQLDGFGTWIWALAEHVRLSGEAPAPGWARAAGLAAEYTAALWPLPCYDYWEEFPNDVHPATLAAIYGGLRAYDTVFEPRYDEVASAIRAFVLREGVAQGHFVKRAGHSEVDSSLLALPLPYGLVAPGDPLMLSTVGVIEGSLLEPGGGLHRYTADTYYGGGEWVLLAGWLGWYDAQVGKQDQARALLRWMEAQADEEGNLPEQVSAHLLAPQRCAEWERRWGPVARPLLWSHAMALILSHALAAPATAE
jgi:GH15 family glucan-1,4-alpha-glucosidase